LENVEFAILFKLIQLYKLPTPVKLINERYKEELVTINEPYLKVKLVKLNLLLLRITIPLEDKILL